MSSNEIVKFYVTNGPRIFPQSKTFKLIQYFKSKYDSKSLELAVKECFGERRLADCSKRLVIPSYNIGEDDVYLFKTPHHKRLTRDWKVPLWKVAMATSAAPTYFPSFRQLDHIRLVDGGVWANNPTMVGIVEAISMLNIPLKSIKVFNLGTTDEIKGRRQKLDNGGFIQWKKDGVEVVMRGQSIGAYTQALHLLGKENILRIDPPVPNGFFKLDKLSESELLSKAAHVSRYYTPKFEKNFTSHMAPMFSPIYK
jgi:patatin-like phospholipase/acyl hydrolase